MKSYQISIGVFRLPDCWGYIGYDTLPLLLFVLYKDFSLVQDMMLAPSMLVGFGLMTFYLGFGKYIPLTCNRGVLSLLFLSVFGYSAYIFRHVFD